MNILKHTINTETHNKHSEAQKNTETHNKHFEAQINTETHNKHFEAYDKH